MRETVSLQNIFNYLKKKFWVLVVFALGFAVIGSVFAVSANEQPNVELSPDETFYQYNVSLHLEIPQNPTQEELDYYETMTVPKFIQSMNSAEKIRELYNEFKNDYTTVESLSKGANTDYEVFRKAFYVNSISGSQLYPIYERSLIVVSCVSQGEGKSRQIVERYLELALPEAQRELENLTITVGEASEFEYEDGTKDYKPLDMPTGVVIILFALLGVMAGLIVLIIVYNYSSLIKNESSLRVNFPDIPILAHFSVNSSKDACAKANLEQSLKTGAISDFIIISSNPNKNDEKLKDLPNSQFINYIDQTSEFYRAAENAQGVALAAFENETKLNLLREIIYHLNENDVKIIGFLLFNT